MHTHTLFTPRVPQVRQLEAIVRIAESLARMELTENVTVEHVEQAMRQV